MAAVDVQTTPSEPWVDLPALRRAAVVAAAVFLAAMACLELPRELGRAAPVWIGNAFVLAPLLNASLRRWPLLLAAGLAGNLLANLHAGEAAPSALGFALVNSLEVLVCAGLVRRISPDGFDPADSDRLREFGLAAIGSAAFAAILGAGLQGVLSGRIGLADLAVWAMADALGLLIVTPCVIILGRWAIYARERPMTGRRLRALAIFTLLTLAVFAQDRYPLLFLIPPLLLLVCLHLETRGAALGGLIAATIAIGFTLAGHGPAEMLQANLTERVLILQVYLAVSSYLGLATAALLVRRRQLRESYIAARDEAQGQARRAVMAEAVAGVGYWRADLTNQTLSWSDQMYTIFGISPGEDLDLATAMAMVHPEDRPLVEAQSASLKAGGEPWEPLPTRIVRPDGEVRHVAGHIVCERNAGGGAVAIFGTMVDMTDQRRAELAVSESEARFRLLAERATDAITRTDVKGVALYASPAIERIIGYSPAEILGRRVQSLMHPEDAPRVQANYVQLVKGERSEGETVEYRARHKNGHWVWLECNPTLVRDAEGRGLEFVDVLRDVTTRKALEGELAAAREAAEAAAAVKGQFLANMSHELRTPLTAVLGFSSLLAEQTELSPTSRGYVDRVANASKALLTTVNDILDFSRLEAGHVEIAPQAISPGVLARETLELFSTQADAKGVRLAFEAGPGLPPFVSADPDRLRQILLNLTGNAVKFTQAGEVRVEVAYDRTAERLAFAVVDTGPGLSAEETGRLFLRFSQVQGPSAHKHGGTGLGLAISKGLAEAMGGTIGVESTPGEGSRFWFTVAAPACDAPAVQAAAQAAPGPAAEARVLVVDDNPVNRELARAILETHGVEVAEAADGEAAVAFAARTAFDVILMDVRMPGLDGPGAVARIRAATGPNQDAPILAFSADGDRDRMESLMAQGFDDFVCKPILAVQLIEAIAAWADRRTNQDGSQAA